MTSIYQQALGPAFERLHPQIRRRFGLSSADGTASIGRGVMEKLWHGRFYTLPFLYLGSWRRIMGWRGRGCISLSRMPGWHAAMRST